MNPALTLLPALIAVLLDLSFAPGAALFGARPSVVLVTIGLWSVLRPEAEAMVLAPAAGIFLALLGNEPFGASLIALVPLVLAGGFYQRAGGDHRLLFSIALVMVGTLVYAGLHAALARALGSPDALGLGGLRRVAVSMALNGGFAALFALPLALIAGRTGGRRYSRRL